MRGRLHLFEGYMKTPILITAMAMSAMVQAADQPSNNTTEAAKPKESETKPIMSANETNPTATPADVAAPPADAQTTASGLASKVLRAGTGTKKPTASSTVEVHYAGWTTDGKLFDSSYNRGKTISFPLNRVIPGWTEGVQLMVEGEKRRLWIPEKLAYAGAPGAPKGMLVFDVELIKIK